MRSYIHCVLVLSLLCIICHHVVDAAHQQLNLQDDGKADVAASGGESMGSNRQLQGDFCMCYCNDCSSNNGLDLTMLGESEEAVIFTIGMDPDTTLSFPTGICASQSGFGCGIDCQCIDEKVITITPEQYEVLENSSANLMLVGGFIPIVDIWSILTGKNLDSYIEPIWWSNVESTFTGTRLKRCRKRNGRLKSAGPPPNGQSCGNGRMKTCFFDDQVCNNGTPYPQTRCFCDGTEWTCTREQCPAI